MTIEVPKPFWTIDTKYKCRSCGCEFTWSSADGDVLVKFVADDEGSERWLPTYGPNGYLELLAKLLPEYRHGQIIDHRIAKLFDERFREHQELRGAVPRYSVDRRAPQCPRCCSTGLELMTSDVRTNPDLHWLDC